jgi:hypothetical protein
VEMLSGPRQPAGAGFLSDAGLISSSPQAVTSYQLPVASYQLQVTGYLSIDPWPLATDH